MVVLGIQNISGIQGYGISRVPTLLRCVRGSPNCTDRTHSENLVILCVLYGSLRINQTIDKGNE